MTNIVHRVPLEVWINVFGFLQAKDLCQCRLVCQTWNYPAESVIFSSSIYVSRKNLANKLYQVLLEKPQLARFIKDISLFVAIDYTGLNLKILRASFTSNMVNVSMALHNVKPAFFTTLVEAAESLSDKNFRLKRFPSVNDRFVRDEYYIKAAHIFRQSLEELKISFNSEEMDTLLNRLEDFKNLKDLELIGTITAFERIQKLDLVLKNCRGLCELKLTRASNEDDDTDSTEQNEVDALPWMMQHVEQVKTLKKVVTCKASLDLVRYLIYKYPNIELFICYGVNQYDEEYSLGLLNAAKGFPKFMTCFSYHGHQDLQASISSICALNDMPHNISASFIYSISEEDFRATLEVQTSRKGAGILHLGIGLNRRLSSTVSVDILQHLRTALDDSYIIDDIAVDIISYRPRHALGNDRLLTFYYIINNFPALKRLTVAIQNIKYEANISNTRLEMLKIEYAEIDAQVLPQISQQLPCLYSLDISSCSTLDEQQKHQSNICIQVPYSSLALLRIAVKYNQFFNVDHFKRVVRKQCSYLQVTMLDVDMTLYCRLERAIAIVQLSQEEFEARPDKEENVAIIVTCRSVAHIQVDMEPIIRSQVNVAEFVLRKLQLDIDRLRTEKINSSSQEKANAVAMELEDKEKKYKNYLAKSTFFEEKLDSMSSPYVICRGVTSIVKDVLRNNAQ
ncbi:F-box/LRR-repeat protein 5 [Mucor circinelloides]